jgi:nickel transport protein
MPDHAPSQDNEQDITRPPLPMHPPALLVAVFSVLFAAGPAHAHRPLADFTVLPDRHVRIEGWFDPGGDPMRRAKVQIFRPEDRLLVQGQLDDEGRFVFQYPEAEPLEVIVSAGAGHRCSFVIPREKLIQGKDAGTSMEPAPQQQSLHDSSPSPNRRSAWRERFKDALLGVTFLLALGAFILGWRNALKLKSMPSRNSTSTDRAP